MEYTKIEWSDEQVKKFWNYESQFPEKYFTYTYGGRIVDEVPNLFDNVNSILDYGTGIGLLIPHLLKKNVEVTGTDFSNDSIEKVNSTFRGEPLYKGCYHIDEILKLNKKFDLIFCIEMIEHINDHYLDITFNNFKHLLSEKGKIIITTPNNEVLDKNFVCCPNCNSEFHRWQHIKSWNTESLGKVIASHKFKIEKIFTTFFRPHVIENRSITSTIANFIRKNILFRATLITEDNNEQAPHLVAIIKK